VVEGRVNQRFEDHLCLHHQGTDYIRNLPTSWYTWTRGYVGGVNYLLCSVLLLLSLPCSCKWPGQAWLSVRPSSLLKLFFFRPMSITSFTRRSTYPDILCNSEVPLDLMQWPVLMLYYATADFSGLCRLMCVWCSLNLVLIALAVCPIYIFPHSLGIRYTPETLIYSLSLADLNICAVFLLDMCIFLILCFFRIQLILLLMAW
jgi:hypothetical protein